MSAGRLRARKMRQQGIRRQRRVGWMPKTISGWRSFLKKVGAK